MRKFIVCLAVIGVLCIIGSSCSKDSPTTDNEQANAAFEELKSDLSNFSQDYFVHHPSDRAAGPRAPFWKRFLNILVGDVAGFAQGSAFGFGLGGGIIGSAKGAFEDIKWLEKPNINATFRERLEYLNYWASKLPNYENMGYSDEELQVLAMHNIILLNVWMKHGSVYGYSSYEIMEIIEQVFESDPALVQMFFGDEESRYESCEYLQQTIMPVDDYEEVFDNVRMVNPDIADEMDVAQIYAEALLLLETTPNLNEYSSGFMDILDNSDISAESISLIKKSISLAANGACIYEIEGQTLIR